MRIVTTYKTNNNGTGQIVAKGGGKQRTIAYDPALSIRENHRNGSAALAVRLGKSLYPRTEVVEVDNGRAVFEL
jgi:nicotinate-nucleotide pyrophosphorylase